jgi:hypothetical protein
VSTPDKPDHARGWLYVEKLLDEADDERIKKLSDDELRAEIRQGATEAESDPATEWSADDFLARAEALAAKESKPDVHAASEAPAPEAPTSDAPAPPPPEPPKTAPVAPVAPIRRSWRTVGLLAAACFALFLIVKATQGPDIVGHPRPSDHELAEAQRGEAEASCTRKDWFACKASLDDAARLDPGGETEPRVQKARQEIAAGLAGHPADSGR